MIIGLTLRLGQWFFVDDATKNKLIMDNAKNGEGKRKSKHQIYPNKLHLLYMPRKKKCCSNGAYVFKFFLTAKKRAINYSYEVFCMTKFH